ncbi:MAG: hypothetical protein ACOX6P_00370 [Candidatus Merdivicinus sp.]|jgi:hypothetical protein
MKRFSFKMFALILTVFCLCSCQENPKVSTNTGKYLPFPKTEWGMTPQEVMDAYDLSIDEITIMATPQIFTENELKFFAPFAIQTKESTDLFGEKAVLTFYFADLMMAYDRIDTIGLFYAEAKFPDISIEQHNHLEEQLSALAEKSDDETRPTWTISETLAAIDQAEAANEFYSLRKLDAEKELAEPLTTIWLFSEIVEGQQNPNDVIRWYGKNAALAEYLSSDS